MKRGNFMKKVLCAVLASLTALAMCACNGGSASKTTDPTQANPPQGSSTSKVSLISYGDNTAEPTEDTTGVEETPAAE